MAKVKYTKELLEEAAKNATSIAQVCRNIGLEPKGGNYKTVTKKLELFDIDISHFTGQAWNKGKSLIEKTCKISLEEILRENTNYSSSLLRKRLINEGIKKEECEVCGHTKHLELHHINGNHYDNRLENLQILCPNCHAETNNYKGRNSNKKEEPGNLSKKYSKDHYCTCVNCNKEFYSDRVDKVRKFCCRECYNEYLQKIRIGNEDPLQDNFNSIKTISKENLIKEIPNYTNMTSLSKAFGVSRPTIKKYLEIYGLYENFKLKYDYHSKTVLQLNTKGELIKEWPSISDAARCLSLYTTDICDVCKFKRRSAGGFLWKYKD